MKNRPLFYVFAGVVLGEGCYCISKVMAGVCVALCLFLVKDKEGSRFAFAKRLNIKIKISFLMGLLLGCLLMAAGEQIQEPKESIYGNITGTVAEIGAGMTDYIKLSPYQIDGNPMEGGILLYGKSEKLLPGQKVRIQTELVPYKAPVNPGQFDLRQYYRCRNIWYSGFYDDYTIINEREDRGKTFLFHLKKRWLERCQTSFSESDAGIMSAMLLGEKSYMDQELKERYQQNGVAHILAISGLHISMIGGTLYKLLRRIGMPFAASGVGSFLLMIPYCMLIGNAVAAFRATVMLILYIGADIKGRHYDFITATSVAGSLILIESPYYLYDAGFLLSFGAVFSIGCIYPCFRGWKRGAPLWLGLSIWLALLPIQLWFFYEISMCSILLNFIIVPLMGPLLFCGFAGLVWNWKPFFVGCHLILTLYEKLLVFPAIVIGKPSSIQICMYLLSLLLFCMLIKWKKNRYGIFCIMMGLYVLCASTHNGFSIYFLDVGQGDCIVINSPNGQHYMIDGGSSDISKVGKYRILPYLKSQGIQSLDAVILTHFDADHYSGIEEMMGFYPIKKMIIFEGTDTTEEGYQKIKIQTEENQIPIYAFSKGDWIEDGAIRLTCLFPEQGYKAEKNQQSLVFLLSYKEFDCLLTGDLELEGEDRLVAMGLQQAEVLKAGHHGSQNATKEALLGQVKPLYSVISCGKDNRYGHPSQEVLDRLKESGSEILVTAERGAIWMEERKGRFSCETMIY